MPWEHCPQDLIVHWWGKTQSTGGQVNTHILISSSLDFVGWVTYIGFICKTLHCYKNHSRYYSWIIIKWFHDVPWPELYITTKYCPRRWQYWIWLIPSIHLSVKNTAVFQQKHIAALGQSSFEFISLHGDNHNALPDIIPEDVKYGLLLNWMLISFGFFSFLFFFFLLHACNV